MKDMSFSLIIKIDDDGIALTTEINGTQEFTSKAATDLLMFIALATKANPYDVITGEIGEAVTEALVELVAAAARDAKGIDNFSNNKN